MTETLTWILIILKRMIQMYNELELNEKIDLWIKYMKPNIENEIFKIRKHQILKNKIAKKIMIRNFNKLMHYD